ncbi:phospholipase D family protein [Candidatus Palauibacter sp.]|uniref:phospholipase D family protein n=1 Tax=Candidatus Palauibacter sp. TaxID=3101350 RepID=UPI003B58F720
MLGTRERTLLLESLRPPAGYRLRRAVGTSYTLDLIALLTAPLAFTFFDAHDEDGAPVTDPVALLEALRRHAENVTLFCQAGAIAVPKPEQTLLAYLEGSVIEVQPPRAEGIFHPKLWVLAFEADGAPAIYRVLCLSRNLTFARSWDTCLSLEGRLMDRQRGYSRNKPLADLLLALPGLATRPIRAELREDIERMAYEVRRVDFRPPQPFTDFHIHHFGLGRKRGWPLPAASRSLVISPYLVGSVVQKLVREHGLDVLISRPEAFEEVMRSSGREALPKTCYVLSPGADLDSREAQEEEAEQEPNGSPPVNDQVELAGLHAKLFLFENGREARLFTGSANATAAAFGLNVEVLVELFGKKKDCGIASLLGSEDHPRLETLRSLLQEYTPPGDPVPEEDPKKDLERRVERLARILGAARLTATVRDVDAEQRWDIALSGELPQITDEAAVSVWPATLSPEAAQPLMGPATDQGESGGPTDGIATFRGMSFEALTGFFAFEISLREGSHAVRQRFAVTAELIGAPENRKERLLRSLLKDRRRVLRLLLLILMDEGADVSAFLQAADPDDTGSQGSFGGWPEAALLEALLQSLSRSPDRIDEAARLITDLAKTPEGRDLLPDGLSEIWEPVWQARKAVES